MNNRIKSGGRTKGTPNKITKDLRQILKDIVTSEIELMPKTLNQLDPKDRLMILIKLLDYTLPKLELEKNPSFFDTFEGFSEICFQE
jgi:hypothetical protein